ncbi:DHHC zinc finger protein (macronuclear) [Tetrahymena thermophila SB210]|uniref:Palmitoyltransferase n=1 Tax=Tetrahymena thermophila (strain SB210) TaxID=312017 RepID=Q22GD6_TETTS|nr:DHHC zinc finger protein [Tetrahymena thermophila SB210]EAR84395.2 DHHC zinc finger protein [Tetrahymena thermophila SB210]|eukprot:XP_001032058.2 DHHC zinc finger protein [Tetrahymena thermophila SB210]
MQRQKGKCRQNEVNVEKEFIYYLASLLPKCLMILMLIFFYFTYFITYLYPLIAGEIKSQSQIKNLALNSFHTSLVQIASYNDSIISKLQLSGYLTNNQQYAIILALIVNVIAALIIISFYKVTATHPGRVTKEWIQKIQKYIDEKVYQEKIFRENIRLNQHQQAVCQKQEIFSPMKQNEQIQDIYVFTDNSEDEDDEEFKKNFQFDYSSNNTEPIIFYQADGLLLGNNTSCPAQIENQKINYSIDQEDIEENKYLLQQLNEKLNLTFGKDQKDCKSNQSKHSQSCVSVDYAFEQNLHKNQINNQLDVAKADSMYDRDERAQLEEIRMFNMIIEDLEQKGIRFCKKCENFKPPRTHHCSQCRQCISKMDHHCQWLNTCIGLKNYKYFLLIILYSILILAIMCFTYTGRYVQQIQDQNATLFMDFLISFFFYFALVMEALLICFGFYHFQITSQNITTIEYCEKKKDNGQYNSGFKQNFKQAFGDNLWCWFLPTTPIYIQQKETHTLEQIK